MRIERVNINELGVFKRLELEFPLKAANDSAEIHIFTGENGTGKTTLIEILASCSDIADMNTREAVLLTSTLKSKVKQAEISSTTVQVGESKWGIQGAYIKWINFYFDDLLFFYFLQDDLETNKTTISEVDCALFAYSGNRYVGKGATKNFHEDNINPFHDALNFQKHISDNNLFQWLANVKTRAALVKESNTARYNELLQNVSKMEETISRLFNRKVEFVLDPEKLQLSARLDDEMIPLDGLAEGYKSVISWLADLVLRLDYWGFPIGTTETNGKSFILFLDEIDVHLHPEAQRRLLPAIQKLFPTAQIFVTTHSPFVVNSIDGAWIHKLKFDENRNAVLDGPPIKSEDARSYSYVLQEIFGVKERFGIEVEKKLELFSSERNRLFANPNENSYGTIRDLYFDLSSQSEELRALLGFEARQLEKRIGKQIFVQA